MTMVRLGLVGCGNMGRSLVRHASELDNASVSAVSDVTEERRNDAAAEFSAAGIADYHELIDRDDVDAVVVATPGGYHREVVEYAASVGKPIFSEKPLATTVADCDAMIKAVEKAGVKNMVGQVCRYHPTHRRMKQMIADGPLGPVLAMYVARLGGGWGDSHPAWRYSYKLSGGTLMEVNAHELDFMIWLAGPVKRVYAVGGQMLEKGIDYPDVAMVSMTFESGAVGVMHSSNITQLGTYEARFDCMDGSAVVQKLFGGPIAYKLRDGSDAAEVTPEEMKVEAPVKGEMRAFVDAIVNDTTPPITFQDGRNVVAVAEAAYKSVESGKSIELQP